MFEKTDAAPPLFFRQFDIASEGMKMLYEAGHYLAQARISGAAITRQYGLCNGRFVQISHLDSLIFLSPKHAWQLRDTSWAALFSS
ncbi:hypothetical protein D3C81_1342900 [compost metagenome]